MKYIFLTLDLNCTCTIFFTMKLSSSSIVAILIILFNSVTSFAPCTRSNGIHVIDIDFHSRSTLLILHESNDKDNKVKNPFVKASWFAVESFGQIFGTGGKKSKTNYAGTKVEIDLTRAPSNLNEALKRIELDNERSYFLSGQVDVCAYDEDCIFADPFVSFAGRQRFVDNLANLGSFITKYDAKFLGYDVINGGTQVQTKVR